MAAAEDEDFVTIARMHDPVRAQMLRDLLEQAGIPTALPGVEHRGMLGIAGAYIEIPVRVPRKHAEEAAALIAALDDPDAELEPGEDIASQREPPPPPMPGEADGPYRSVSPAAGPDRPRLKRVAAFVAIALTFGLGHVYARRTRAGLALLGAQVLLVGVAMAGTVEPILVVLLVVSVDLFGSLRAVDQYNQSRPPRGAYERVLAIAPWFAVIVAVGFAGLWAFRRVAPVDASRGDIAAMCERLEECNLGAARAQCIAHAEEEVGGGWRSPEQIANCVRCIDDTACDYITQDCEWLCPIAPRFLPSHQDEAVDRGLDAEIRFGGVPLGVEDVE